MAWVDRLSQVYYHPSLCYSLAILRLGQLTSPHLLPIMAITSCLASPLLPPTPMMTRFKHLQGCATFSSVPSFLLPPYNNLQYKERAQHSQAALREEVRRRGRCHPLLISGTSERVLSVHEWVAGHHGVIIGSGGGGSTVLGETKGGEVWW